MKNLFKLSMTAGILLVLPHPTLAQQSESDASKAGKPGILVTADRPSSGEPAVPVDRKILRDLTRQVTGRLDTSRPITRFHRPVCLGVAGVKREFVQDFAERILANAQAAKVPLATRKCRVNALVLFTGESREELLQLQKKKPRLLGDIGPSAFKKMIESRDEAFAWHVTTIIGATGKPIQPEGNSDFSNGDAPINRSFGPSGRIALAYQVDIARAVVLIDRDATEGMSALQLADYATLRLFTPTAEVAGDIEGAPETIMTLFKDREMAPAELTRFDLAYLTSVYGVNGTARANTLYSATISGFSGDR